MEIRLKSIEMKVKWNKILCLKAKWMEIRLKNWNKGRMDQNVVFEFSRQKLEMMQCGGKMVQWTIMDLNQGKMDWNEGKMDQN